jgi:hypothetical protein
VSRHDERDAPPEAPRVEAPRVEATPVAAGHDWTLRADQSVAVILCPFRLCDWHSQDARTLGTVEQDGVVRWHLLDEHPEDLHALCRIAGAPAGVCARPHPRVPGRWCTEPRGHAGSSHGDGCVDRWVQR